MTKDGRKPKDAALTPNLDKKGGLSKRDLLKAQVDKRKQELREARKQGAVDRQLPRVKEKAGSDEDRMLADMWWVYRNAEFEDPATKKKMTGRQKLLQLVQSDDKQYLFMVKELLRIEALRKEKSSGDGGGKAVFVVLKGLHDEDVKEDPGLGMVDHKQIMAAIDPTAEKVDRVDSEGDEFGWLRPEDQK